MSGARDETASPAERSRWGRDRIAGQVVIGSFIALFLLVLALVLVAKTGSPDMVDATEKAFTAVLPVLAGWVGTVLAFYFSAASHERTSASLDKALDRSNGGKPAAPIAPVMIPTNIITDLIELEKNPANTITVGALRAVFDHPLPGGGTVTRLICLEKGVFRYLIHQATLHAFILKSAANFAAADSATLSDLLKDAEIAKQISSQVAFVSAGASLAEARAALDRVPGAQDIIVTGTGEPAAPMLGWLSNIDLIKAVSGG